MKKKSDILHIIYTPFTGVGLHGGFRGDEWYSHRIEIFKKYTMKSMMNQSNKDFVHWFSFRRDEMHNPLTEKFFDYLISYKYPCIFTFDGLMYWDDKFTKYTFKTALRNLLMMLWDCWSYKEFKSSGELIMETWEDKNKSLPDRLTNSIRTLRDVLIQDVFRNRWVYLTRIDSDDMFHKDAIKLIQNQSPTSQEALIFNSGYIYNVKTGQLADWNPPTNPPFHTIIFPIETFFNPERHLAYYKDFKTHEDITRVFKCETLEMKDYMVSFHGKHISTGWTSPLPRRVYHKLKYKPKGYCYTTSGKNISTHWESRTGHVKNFMIGKEYEGEEKELILKDFGITCQ